MPRHRIMLLVATALLLPGAAPLRGSSADAVARIVQEGTQHSQAMTILQHLADVIGPRLTNSPGIREAENWTAQRFHDFGIAEVRKEGFEFGRGWWIERSSARMIGPRPAGLAALPISWTPATAGPVRAPVIFAPMAKEADFGQWHGKLAGRIVLVSAPDAANTPPGAKPQSDADLAAMEAERPVARPSGDPDARLARYARFPRALDRFLKAEGALGWVSMSRLDGKLVMSDGDGFTPGDTPQVPGLGMAVEDYRRLVRLTLLGQAPVLEIDSLVHFDDSDSRAYNIIADIPGTDPKAAYVMAGAHLDSVAAADGAADDGAGVAMVMEAARILATMPRPRRTIRFALWGAEEQGMLGLLAYTEKNLATRGNPGSGLPPRERFLTWSDSWPIVPRPGWRDLSIYFNLDNGAGRIRGIYADGNLAAVPIFRTWLAPFARMGATSVPAYADGGAEHDFLQMAGLPGFAFIQDWNDYGRMHHTTMDTLDHVKAEDMRQASIVLAGVLWSAANADSAFPRRPLPTASGRAEPVR